MTPDNSLDWAQYLTNPYALAGFVILLCMGLVNVLKLLPSSNVVEVGVCGLKEIVDLAKMAKDGVMAKSTNSVIREL